MLTPSIELTDQDCRNACACSKEERDRILAVCRSGGQGHLREIPTEKIIKQDNKLRLCLFGMYKLSHAVASIWEGVCIFKIANQAWHWTEKGANNHQQCLNTNYYGPIHNRSFIHSPDSPITNLPTSPNHQSSIKPHAYQAIHQAIHY